MRKELTLIDVVSNFDDNTQVYITAYNIPIYSGSIENIPAMYCIYPVTDKLKIQCGILRIVLDC